MGDMGEMFKAWDEHKKEKKRSNAEKSRQVLESKGIAFDVKNGGIHLIVYFDGADVDFWPSTGLFIERNGKSEGRGVFSMIKKFGG